jgi:hypothetical protein
VLYYALAVLSLGVARRGLGIAPYTTVF